jgi:hypothetical protein
VFENNRILDNAGGKDRGSSGAAVVIQGPHHNLVFRGNQIGNSRADTPSGIGILVSPEAHNLQADSEQFVNVQTRIETKK